MEDKEKTEDIRSDMASLMAKIIDYRELMDKSTEGFVGRKWLINEVDKFLKKKEPRCFLILGKPGCGKTSFMAELVKRKRLLPHHFIGMGSQIIESYSKSWCNPTRFAESVGYQLFRNYGEWIMDWESQGIEVMQNVKNLKGILIGAEIGKLKATPWFYKKPMIRVEQEVEQYWSGAVQVGVIIREFIMDIEQIVNVLLKTPLENVAKINPGQQFLVLIDGLDEAIEYSEKNRNICEMLPNGSLPKNVRFLLTSAPGPHIDTPHLSQVQRIWLSEDENGERNPHILEDVKEYVKGLAEEDSIREMLNERNISLNNFIERVVSASGGNFLYLRHYAQQLRDGDKTLLNLNKLPKGLYAIYKNLYNKIKTRKIKENSEAYWNEKYKPVLGILAVAREPLTVEQIANFSEVDIEAVGTVLQSLERFLVIRKISEDWQYRIFHKTFGEFIVSKKNRDIVDGQKAHKKIVKYHFKGKGSWEEDYAMKYLMSHMIAGQTLDDLEKLLTNINYIKKKWKPEQQYCFQSDFVNLLRNEEITTDRLVNILEEVLKVITKKLESGKEKADWLDIFAFWIHKFGKNGNEERNNALKDVANKFDQACGIVSKKLAIKYEGEGDYDWALRFAELCTWVYQRAEDYKKCAEACEFAENMCMKEEMEEAYKLLGRTEFIRMRARALTKLSIMEKDENMKKIHEARAHEAYQELNAFLKFDELNDWDPKEEDWQKLEEDDKKEVLTPPTVNKKPIQVQVVSNAHDSISAMYIIQTFRKHGMNIKWIHSTKFEPIDLAPPNIKFTVLIGGPKAPGVSSVAQKFLKNNKEEFLELYFAKGMVAKTLRITEGKTVCYMVGGPSKINTLKAAYDFTQDPEVLNRIK